MYCIIISCLSVFKFCKLKCKYYRYIYNHLSLSTTNVYIKRDHQAHQNGNPSKKRYISAISKNCQCPKHFRAKPINSPSTSILVRALALNITNNIRNLGTGNKYFVTQYFVTLHAPLIQLTTLITL